VIEEPPEHRAGLAVGLGAGSRVAGYRLEEQIGAGGMAMVYRARDERLGRLVALKIMAPALAADEMFRQRFIRESRAAAAVDDPHIIPVYDAGEADGVLFIAIRYVSGGDVGSLLRREGPLAPAQVASIISPVASALDAAHASGLVHRDVKPTNMLLDTRPGRPDHVYLSDFGLSKGVRSGGLTGTGQFLGTPDYTPPEQIEGRPVDGRTDQYALACAAFELLTGSVPFAPSEGWAVVWAHLNKPPPTVTARRPDVSPVVDQVLARALAKAPQNRYPSCWEFAAALREALGLAPYDLGSGATPAAGHTGNAAGHTGNAAGYAGNGVRPPTTQDAGNRPAAAASTVIGNTARVAPRTRAGGRRPGKRSRRRIYIAIALAGAVVLATPVVAVVAADVLDGVDYHQAAAPGRAAVASPLPPLFSRFATFTAPRKPGLWQYVSAVAFSPDGRTLAGGLLTGSGNTSRVSGDTYLWNVATRKRILTLPGLGGSGAGGAEAFSPDGKELAVAGGPNHSLLYQWDVPSGRPAGGLADNPKVTIGSVAFSPDGRLLATEDITGRVYLWSPVTGQLVRPIGGSAAPFATALAFSPDSKTLATAENFPGGKQMVYLWNPATGRPFAALSAPALSAIPSVAFSPDGKMIAVSGGLNGSTSIWDTATRKRLVTFTDPRSFGVAVVRFSPDSEMLAAGDMNGKTYLWNMRTQTLAATLTDPGGQVPPVLGGEDRNQVMSVAFSPDGKTLATSDTNGSAYLWRVR
jgi:serine/threonine-protein kinase